MRQLAAINVQVGATPDPDRILGASRRCCQRVGQVLHCGWPHASAVQRLVVGYLVASPCHALKFIAAILG